MHRLAVPGLVALTLCLEACASRSLRPAGVATSGGAVAGTAVVDETPKLLIQTPPEYPPDLRSARVGGRVTFEFVLDTLGQPELDSFQVVSSPHSDLSDAVRNALRLWRYTPARVNGRAVRVRLKQWVDFAVRRH